jgi:hypothetical protein
MERYSSPVAGLEWSRGFQEVKVPRLCMLIVCILYLSCNISITFEVFVICLPHAVISLFWCFIWDEVPSGAQHVLHMWFTLNCIYKLHCMSKYSCMNVEFYACHIWSFQGCDYGECCLVGYDVGRYLKSSPVTSLEWPRGFQEVKVPRFHDNGTGWW